MMNSMLNGAERYLDLAAGIIIAIDENQLVRFINKKGCALLESTREEIIGKNWFDHFLPEDNREEIRKVFFKLIETKNVFFEQYESVVQTSKGNIRFVSWYGTLISQNEQEVSGILSLGEDITDKTLLLRRLSHQERAKRKELISAVTSAQEKERTDIAVELHDNVNQLLVTCKLLLEQETYNGNGSLFVKNSAQYLQKAMDEIRKVSHKLHLEGMEDLSVEKAIKEVVYTINLSHKLNLNLEIEGKEYIDLYSATLSLTILRIIQEQLNNIIKYAQAANVEIKLHAGPTAAELEIKDDGKGFDLKKVKKGLGIKNIYHRTELFGGTVYISTAPGEGCILSVHLPLE